MAPPELLLDPALKLWVLLPILAVMIMVGLARHYATILVKPDPPLGTPVTLKEQAYLQYAESLRLNNFNLSSEAFAKRVSALVPALRNGAYLADPNAKAPSAMPSLVDPSGMEVLMGGLRNQVLTYVPQTLLMQWVSAFFSGFVVMRLPFPLTAKFKTMLQANIPTDDLDVQWVSSISWYIILVIGLGGVYSLLLGNENVVDTQLSGSQTAVVTIEPNADKRKLFEMAADQLDLVKHKSIFPGIEGRVLAIPL